MTPKNSDAILNRRQFLSATGGGLFGAAVPAALQLSEIDTTSIPDSNRSLAGGSNSKRKIPIGVFDPVYKHLSLESRGAGERPDAPCRQNQGR